MIPHAEVYDVGVSKHQVQLERYQAVNRSIEGFIGEKRSSWRAQSAETEKRPWLANYNENIPATIPIPHQSIDPPEAFAGDDVTLTGRGLSGTNVIVRFGATNAPVGPQPFASRFSVGVPLALASGPVAVTVSVNGNDTNSLQFTVVS
jgi:hypothetical protein